VPVTVKEATASLEGAKDAGDQPAAPRSLLAVCETGGQLVPELFRHQQVTLWTFPCIQVEHGAHLAQEVASLCEPDPRS